MKRMLFACAALAAALIAPAYPKEAPAQQHQLWAEMAKEDIAFIERLVKDAHPGPLYAGDPGFAQRLDDGRRLALQHADAARSLGDWRKAVLAFVLSFRDGHMQLEERWVPSERRWPGFVVDGDDDGWFAWRPAGGDSEGPPTGARLISCDGELADAFLKARGDLRFGDWTSIGSQRSTTWQVFIDEEGAAPMKSCVFADNGKETRHDLNWKTLSPDTFRTVRRAMNRWTARGFSLTRLEDGGHWVQVGNLYEEEALTRLLRELDGAIATVRSGPYVVFDLRSNPGGSSPWADLFAKSLWGEAALETRRQARDAARTRSGNLWRVSAVSIGQARRNLENLGASDTLSLRDYFSRLAAALAAAPSPKTALLPYPAPTAPPAPPAALAPLDYAKPVYVVTDEGCYSSCILMVNTLVMMGATQLGWTTGDNEEYGPIAESIDLPSQLAGVRIPIGVIQQPPETLVARPRASLPCHHLDDACVRAAVIAYHERR